MAIKVTGTTVINDSRAFENLTDIEQIIRKPSILSPTNNETDTEFSGLVIEGSPFQATYGNNRDYREFQVDLATGDFSTPVVSQQVNSDSATLSTDLAGNTEHKVRIRDVDLDGIVSEFSDVVSFTTAVNPFTTLGASVCGGFYMGAITAAGQCYALIVSPRSGGLSPNNCFWKTSNTSTSGACSTVDGYGTTYSVLDNTNHPAGNWTATRTINGFSDWYLPAIDELVLFYDNGAGSGTGNPLPAGDDFPTGEQYWSSTSTDISGACSFRMGTRRTLVSSKGNKGYARAVRRVPI